MNKLHKQFVPYQQSFDMKELGFDEPCFGHYFMKSFYLKEYRKQGNGIILRPTFSQAFEWFREKHGLHSYIDELKLTTGELVYDYVIVSDDIDEEDDDGRKWKTVKETQLACLVDLINIVKTKKL